jgi:hypothetical protein
MSPIAQIPLIFIDESMSISGVSASKDIPARFSRLRKYAVTWWFVLRQVMAYDDVTV